MKKVLVLFLLLPLSLLSAEVIPFLKPSFLNLKKVSSCLSCSIRKVQEYFSKHFYMVEIDIRGSNEVVDLDGKKLAEKQFSIKHGVRLTPVFLFFDQEGRVVARVPGYVEPEEFFLLGRYVVEGHYKNKNLVQFLKDNRKK